MLIVRDYQNPKARKWHAGCESEPSIPSWWYPLKPHALGRELEIIRVALRGTT
jgi:hypothetical protein